ncbi:MAG: hypothetical protein IPJ87_15250 [Flavobacteriales bacterium]|nr:hypothetical protein [Flavobacteriales bacterium]
MVHMTEAHAVTAHLPHGGAESDQHRIHALWTQTAEQVRVAGPDIEAGVVGHGFAHQGYHAVPPGVGQGLLQRGPAHEASGTGDQQGRHATKRTQYFV